MRWMPLILTLLLSGCIVEETQTPPGDEGAARPDAAFTQVDAQPMHDAQRLTPPPIPDAEPPDAMVPDAMPPDAEAVEPVEPQQAISAQAGDVITLDGRPFAQSLGLDPANVMAWYWRVVRRPEGSVSQPVESFFSTASPGHGGPADDPSTPTAKFFVDIQGHYTFIVELRADGQTHTMELEFEAPCDLSVWLRWHTPGDPDETDHEGTDLDLHLMHPDAEGISTEPYDCYAQNQNPDWPGHEGPSLDIDDTDGAGPESIWLGTIAHREVIGGAYTIAVHTHRNEDHAGASYGPSVATVQIYLCRQLRAEYEHTLEATGDTWQVAQVHYDDDGAHVTPAD